jgi:hypothetical protein
MQGATTVEWVFYTLATHVARLTRERTQHIVTFPNAEGLLLDRTRLLFVEVAMKPLKPKGVSLSTSGLNIQWNAMKSGRGR